jgi:transcription elongation factor
MPDLFKEVIPSILQTKKNVFETQEDYKDYVPFVVNRALSFHQDCILYVNELNMHNQLDKDLQYSFYLNTIRPMKRKFQPWQKAEVLKDIQCVKEFFGYNNQKAKDALSILSDEQIAEIKIRIDKGGVKS